MGGPGTREDVVDYVPSARATRGGWRPGARRPPRGDRPGSFRAKQAVAAEAERDREGAEQSSRC